MGREEELKILARNLKGSTETARSVTAGVSGVGGVGKTQLAGEFVYRYGQYFEGGVYWLSFADPVNVRAEIVACGSSGSPELGSDFPRLPFDEKIKRVTAAWQSALPRLLVFDNCEDVNLLKLWAPPSGACRVLITSRGKLEDPTLGVYFVELDVLARQESVALLRKYLSDIPAEDSVLNAIAEELGDLPLALDLAGRFLFYYRNTDTPHDYLADLVELRESDARTLLNHESLKGTEGVSPTRHEMSVARTFELDSRRLDATGQIDGPALKVLARAACLAPDESIPRHLLLSTLDLPDGDREAARRAEDAVRRLTQLGLVQGREEVKMHRLVKVAVASAIDDPQARPEVENSVANAVGHLVEVGNYQAVLPLLPHLRFLTNSIRQRQDPLAGYMCFVLGGTLTKMRNKKDYEEAISHTERALSISERSSGLMDFRTLRVLLNLGAIRKALGHLDEAIAVYRQALEASRRVCGCRDPETAYVHNNLGSALRDKAIASEETRFLVKALRHYKRALKIREKKRPQHPDLAESLTNMGALMVDLCRYEDAWGYLQRSLQIVGEPPVPLNLLRN